MKKEKRPNRCNVLEATAREKHLWQFSPDGGRPKVEENVGCRPDNRFRRSLGKDVAGFISPRLNVAWLPADQGVFARGADADDGRSGGRVDAGISARKNFAVAGGAGSLELQSVQSREINNITAVVIIVSRDLVEERIGAIEAGGYQPDRLELPHVYQLVAEVPETDGVWVYPWTKMEGILHRDMVVHGNDAAYSVD